MGKEHFAIDGCKLPSDASKEWSGKHKDLKKKSDKMKTSAQKIIDKHLANDSDKDPNSGDKRRELQTIDTLLKNADKIDEFLKNNEVKMGKGRRPSEVNSNITDNDSTKMTTSKGTIQGYNCQTAADELHQVVIYAEAVGVGSDQSALKPMIEGIRKNLSADVLDGGVLVTADTGYSSVINMENLYAEGINSVVPDNQFRQRDERIAGSETYQKHKELRKKTRNDKLKSDATAIPSSEFFVDIDAKTCVCPNGKQMMFQGDHFKGTRGNHIRFRGKISDCQSCPMQSRCMKKPIKDQGRQVSFYADYIETDSCLKLINKRIDSEQGRKDYGRRMWTIEPVLWKHNQQ
ncbi:MAG: transposase [Pseudomonadales bacterium]|nr:transposase [Pseudomonadales bacterium]